MRIIGRACSAARGVSQFLFLGGAGSRQDTGQALVAFVAGILINRAGERRNGIIRLHGFVHVPGSSIVISYFSVSGPLREKRSVTCSFSLDTDMKALGL